MAEYIKREDVSLSDFEIVMCNGDYKEALKMLLEKVEKIPSADVVERKWIPVTERLPEEGAAVNITWVNHSPVIYYQHIKDKPQTATGVYYRGKWYWWSAVVQDYLAEYGKCEPDEMDAAIEVTHWMPLPEPPKGDE